MVHFGEWGEGDGVALHLKTLCCTLAVSPRKNTVESDRGTVINTVMVFSQSQHVLVGTYEGEIVDRTFEEFADPFRIFGGEWNFGPEFQGKYHLTRL